jgi:DNA-directed RNA polymerase subunit M/transcription elongation factor TFIIS
MIRIKCPKCAAPLALDDDEAGGVAECTECGAKFRVPAAKGKASVRAADDDDDDDEDDDDEDDEEERASSRRRGRRRSADDDEDDEDEVNPDDVSKRDRTTSGSLKSKLLMAAGMFVVILVAGIASTFLKIGITAFIGSVIGGLLCSIMVVRAATKDGGTLAFICVVISLMMFLCGALAIYQVFLNSEHGIKMPFVLIFFFSPLFWSAFLAAYVIPHWRDSQRFAMVWVFCVVMAVVTFIGANINRGFIEVHREKVKQRLGFAIQTGAAPTFQPVHRG